MKSESSSSKEIPPAVEIARAIGAVPSSFTGTSLIKPARLAIDSDDNTAPDAIAASCSERDLIQLGGRVGSTLYALSREPAARSAPSLSYGHRKPITLSTKPLSTFAPVDDEFDDEETAQAVTA